MTIDQHLLHSIILPSAKRKLHDYTDFRWQFPVVADHVLIRLILELTTAKSEKIIAGQISRELAALGYRCQKEELLQFVTDMAHIFRREVAVTMLMYDMQENGYPEQEIINIVSQGFGGRKPLYVVN